MKYWNKSKDYRKTWTCVQFPLKRSRIGGSTSTEVVFPEMQNTEAMKQWCQQQSSRGRFYFEKVGTTAKFGIQEWLFEDPKDATWFALKWV